MKQPITIKEEAIEVMRGIAGHLAFLEFETAFDSAEGENEDEYEFYFLNCKSDARNLSSITVESENYSDNAIMHFFRICLPETVSLFSASMEIRNGYAYLEITFDFTDFANANIEGFDNA